MCSKKGTFFSVAASLPAFLGLFGTLTVSSQENFDDLNGPNTSVEKYTLMERFEPNLTLTASERVIKNAERFAEIKAKMQMLDTLYYKGQLIFIGGQYTKI